MELNEYHIGVTASRYGLNELQLSHVRRMLADLRTGNQTVLHLHHGDCVGGDAQIHALAAAADPKIVIHVHPPTSPRFRAFCKGDVVYLEEVYYLRNRAICQRSKVLWVFPDGMQYRQGSGTWLTWRIACSMKLPRIVVGPMGPFEP